ncbi:MAG: hypothetical protein UT02_C0005G0009 [Parcubacteria group bacterium GW2011_GWC2_38_7]|nr:MAG: hypothetical protein UT02_C0005G0009 [Parcubacteria group bacterium GW2011_GWC2_38_7]
MGGCRQRERFEEKKLKHEANHHTPKLRWLVRLRVQRYLHWSFAGHGRGSETGTYDHCNPQGERIVELHGRLV